MAGDTTVVANPGVGGASFKVDADGGGAFWPYSKLAWGPSATQNEVDDATGKRVPIKLAESSATVTTSETGHTSIVHGQASIPSTAGGTALASNACKEATVKNLQSNANVVWIGITGVSSANGYELLPGESITLHISNTNLIFCISPSGSQTVCFIATN